MKSIATAIAASSLLAVLATAQTPNYTVTDLGTFGGTSATAYGVNAEGRVAGVASFPAGNQHAFLSGIGGTKYDLGTLGGPNSEEGGINSSGQQAMYAETGKKDPSGEDFCGFGTNLICLPALWSGTLTALPTLGGNSGMAFTINDQGQQAGVAETATKDSTCMQANQVVQFEAALWGPNPGQVQELPPLPGDTVGFAYWINNNSQVVGGSGTCANTALIPVGVSPHAVLWNNGSPVALGSLGGTMLGTAAGINDQGQVVGCTDLATELPGFPGVQCHGFLWTQATGMQDLGTVETDFSSLPDQINNHGDLVGTSCDDQGNCRAFLRPAQGKAMLDLNALIPANSPLYLFWAFGINDSGEIAGMAIETSTGDLHAFLATPSKTAAATGTLPADALRVTTPMALPESTRKLLRRRMGMAGW